MGRSCRARGLSCGTNRGQMWTRDRFSVIAVNLKPSLRGGLNARVRRLPLQVTYEEYFQSAL